MSRETTKDGLVIKNPNAAWFRMVAELHGKNTRLKELNREMVYALNLARPFLPPHGSISNTFKRVLAKAGDEGK